MILDFAVDALGGEREQCNDTVYAITALTAWPLRFHRCTMGLKFVIGLQGIRGTSGGAGSSPVAVPGARARRYEGAGRLPSSPSRGARSRGDRIASGSIVHSNTWSGSPKRPGEAKERVEKLAEARGASLDRAGRPGCSSPAARARYHLAPGVGRVAWRRRAPPRRDHQDRRSRARPCGWRGLELRFPGAAERCGRPRGAVKPPVS